MCHGNEPKLPALQVKRPKQNTALNAKTEGFITAKISGNAWSRTLSDVRQCSSQLQKHRAARMSRRLEKVCDWDGGHPWLTAGNLLNYTRNENAHKVRRKILFYYVAVTVLSPREGLCGLTPPNKVPSHPNWNIKC